MVVPAQRLAESGKVTILQGAVQAYVLHEVLFSGIIELIPVADTMEPYTFNPVGLALGLVVL